MGFWGFPGPPVAVAAIVLKGSDDGLSGWKAENLLAAGSKVQDVCHARKATGRCGSGFATGLANNFKACGPDTAARVPLGHGADQADQLAIGQTGGKLRLFAPGLDLECDLAFDEAVDREAEIGPDGAGSEAGDLSNGGAANEREGFHVKDPAKGEGETSLPMPIV